LKWFDTVLQAKGNFARSGENFSPEGGRLLLRILAGLEKLADTKSGVSASDSFKPFRLIKCDKRNRQNAHKRLNFQFARKAPFGLYSVTSKI